MSTRREFIALLGGAAAADAFYDLPVPAPPLRRCTHKTPADLPIELMAKTLAEINNCIHESLGCRGQ